MTTQSEALIQYYENDLASLKYGTAKIQRLALEYWIDWHDNTNQDLDTADPLRVKRWTQFLQTLKKENGTRQLDDQTIISYATSLSSVYTTIHEDYDIPHIIREANLTHLNKDDIDDDEDEVKYIPVEDARKLLRTCREPVEKVVVGTLLHTGLRLKEIRNLRYTTIYPDEGYLRTRTAKRQNPHKRNVFFPIDHARVLHDWIGNPENDDYGQRAKWCKQPPNAENSEYLLTGRVSADKMMEEDIREIVVNVAKRAGIQARNPEHNTRKYTVTPHTLRHSFCVHRAQNGMPLSTIADLAGHSSVDITRKFYLIFSKEDLARADKAHRPTY